jgi:hypothetical protein
MNVDGHSNTKHGESWKKIKGTLIKSISNFPVTQ